MSSITQFFITFCNPSFLFNNLIVFEDLYHLFLQDMTLSGVTCSLPSHKFVSLVREKSKDCKLVVALIDLILALDFINVDLVNKVLKGDIQTCKSLYFCLKN